MSNSWLSRRRARAHLRRAIREEHRRAAAYAARNPSTREH